MNGERMPKTTQPTHNVKPEPGQLWRGREAGRRAHVTDAWVTSGAVLMIRFLDERMLPRFLTADEFRRQGFELVVKPAPKRESGPDGAEIVSQGKR